MKKYLMTGVAALAFAATLTSCSKAGDLYDEGKVNEQKEKNITESYAAAFEKAFGKVGPNVDWGFSSKAATRSVNVNGNEWKTRPAVTEEEAAAVYAWVNKPKSEIPEGSYYEVSPVNMKNFFVTQVWGKDNNTNDANAKYKDYDNGNVFGGEKMNHLQISKSADRLGIDGVASANSGQGAINANWDHANNFNASQNRDWDGNTMFVDWGTQNFAYHNSTDSKYHDKWIIVDGAYITDSKGVTHTGKYYVCFDFIARNPNAYTNFQNANGQNYEVPGAWKSVEDAVSAGAKARIYKSWDSANNVAIYDEGPAVQSNWKKGNIVGGNMIVDANEYYTDWIVRLVEAKPNVTPLYRVIAEDLTASQAGDFDFNDVVFDVVKYENGKTTLRLQACGGTLPLTVGGVDVHALYDDTTPDANGKLKMFNTGAGNTHEPVDFQVDGQYTTPEQLKELPIKVFKENQWVPLTANKGVAACKILVDDRFPIVPERQSIANANGNFTTYVTGNWKDSDNFWWIQTGE